jgi:hypothetical protein
MPNIYSPTDQADVTGLLKFSINRAGLADKAFLLYLELKRLR